ncbi:hypothetical protein C5167_004085 [Papaver somniferum]|nr:hypothetical protein C5167_004085 [Papaver somniferum]
MMKPLFIFDDLITHRFFISKLSCVEGSLVSDDEINRKSISRDILELCIIIFGLGNFEMIIQPRIHLELGLKGFVYEVGLIIMDVKMGLIMVDFKSVNGLCIISFRWIMFPYLIFKVSWKDRQTRQLCVLLDKMACDGFMED